MKIGHSSEQQLEEKLPHSSQKDNFDSTAAVLVKEENTKELEEKIPLTTIENSNSGLPLNLNLRDHIVGNSQAKLGKKENEKSNVVGGDFSSSCNNYDKESIFFKVFEELSKENDNGLVDYEKLRLRLISTGKFFAGDAVIIIEQMVRTGKIVETSFHLYRRMTSDIGIGVGDNKL